MRNYGSYSNCTRPYNNGHEYGYKKIEYQLKIMNKFCDILKSVSVELLNDCGFGII